MNQNSRKKKGLSKRVLALLLCGFCLLAASPVSALALETEETQITEESISEQQSESTGEALLSLSSEISESQTQQSTSGETIEPMNEKETDAVSGNETETGSETETETQIETDGQTDGPIPPDENDISNVQSYTDAMHSISVRIASLEPSSESYDEAFETICGELEWLELEISRAYGAGEITSEEFETLTAQLNDVMDVLFADVEPEEDFSVYADAAPDTNYILVGKTFEGITPDEIPEAFSITVQNTGASYSLTNETATISEDGLTWKWRIDNVGAGTYEVSESNANVNNYDLETSGLGTVEVKAADFLVTYAKETTCNHKNWPVAIDGDQNVLFAAALTGGGCVVISKEPLTATQRETVAASVIGIGGNWKAPVTFYSIRANGNGPWSIHGKSLEYHPDTQEIWLSRTSDWTHVATVRYSITEASNPDISVTNTYTPNTRDLTVKKTVSGNLYDANKEFAFTVTYGKKTETFSLKKDEEKTISGIPVGAEVTVTEDPDGYHYSFVSITDGVTRTDIENGVSFTMPAQNVTVVINNDKTVTVDTGISLETLPFILILGVVATGAVLLIRKRGNRYDDETGGF